MAPTKNPHYEGDVAGMKKEEGRDDVVFPPRRLTIVWGGDDRYWKVPNNNEMPAELVQVSWLEVTGSVAGTEPSKDYVVIFTLSLTPDAFGWGSCPVYIMVKRGERGNFASKKYLLTDFGESKFDISCKLPKSEDNTDRNLYFGLYEVWSGKWKGGLNIHRVIVREV